MFVTTKCPAFGPAGAMSSVAVRPPQLLSHAAHKCVLSGSYSRSMIWPKPLAMVATRLKAPVVLLRA